MIMHPRVLALVSTLAAIGMPPASAADPAPSTPLARVDARLATLRDELIAVRRDLHRHPEVSGEEARTAGIVADRLRRLGLPVRTDVGGHGVVTTIQGRLRGPEVAVRADMDAVRSAAPDPVPFASETPGVRHICGHDLHTTVALGLAESLVSVRDTLAGSVTLVFQPAEERATGARAMIADGAMADRDPIAFFALHTAPLEVGQVGSRPGTMLAGRDRVTFRLRGSGDLDAAAKRVRQTIADLSTISFEQALQSTAGGFVFAAPPTEQRGDDGERLLVAVLTVSDDRRAHVRGALESLKEALQEDGTSADLSYEAGWVAGVHNDPALEERARRVIVDALGEGAHVPVSGVIPMFSEDFGSFLTETPGIMLFLGVSNSEKGWVGMPHSPGYVADEEAIFVGIRTLAALIFDALDSPSR